MTEEFLTVKQVQKILHLSRYAVQRKLRSDISQVSSLADGVSQKASCKDGWTKRECGGI